MRGIHSLSHKKPNKVLIVLFAECQARARGILAPANAVSMLALLATGSTRFKQGSRVKTRGRVHIAALRFACPQ